MTSEHAQPAAVHRASGAAADDGYTDGDLAAIEQETQRIGRHLFENLDEDQPSIFHRRWWDDRVMSWAMSDEALKVQLFRFVDVLPMLRTSDAVTRHLNEYLQQVRDRLAQGVLGGHAQDAFQVVADL